jgi:hypothetical protein
MPGLDLLAGQPQLLGGQLTQDALVFLKRLAKRQPARP